MRPASTTPNSSSRADGLGALPSPPAPERTIRADHLILGLFVALAAATAVAMLLLITTSQQRLKPAEFAAIAPRLWGALAGDLALPVVAWFLIKWLNKRRKA